MRVLLLSRYARLGASSRLRFFQFLPKLQKEFDIEVFPLFCDDYLNNIYQGKGYSKYYIIRQYLQRFFQLRKASQFDFLWIEKELFPFFPAWAESYLSFKNIPYIVDYDDAIFHNYDLSNNPVKKRLANKIDGVMHRAEIVSVGNSYLADRAIKAGAKRVEIIPTVIDIERYTVKKTHSNNNLVIGWIGSLTTAKYLSAIASVFRELTERFDFTLRVIGVEFEMEGVNVVSVPWTEDTEVNEINNFDIGIMPLIDSPWERGKCGYKLIQYMACGIPVIASPVGVNTTIVNGSKAGFIATTSEEWLVNFEKLLSNIELRKELGAKGRVAVEKKYSVQVVTPQLIKLFNKLKNSTP